MNEKTQSDSSSDGQDSIEKSLLGYLNFSNGSPDAKFRMNFNQLDVDWGAPAAFSEIQSHLGGILERLREESPAFKDSSQAEAVLDLVFDHVWPAYRQYHSDLLFHVDEGDFARPFFVAILCEAVLSQKGPWENIERIIQGSIEFLNDFIGHRPVGLLENGRQMQAYSHEKYRPVPYYFSDVGISEGPYQEILEQAFQLFREAPPEFMETAHFHLKDVHELAIDVRAYDHLHPVYRRTNYLFGEWDPHVIGLDGNYHRFILRKVILDALISWIEQESKHVPREEVLFDAGAALCGTILMASSISGSGPDTHDSTVSLTTLLPSIARLRDQFYNWLLSTASGERKKRLNEHLEKTHQPFGHVRQHLNLFLSGSGAGQVRHRELSLLYARMGFPEQSREEALRIPATSLRFESEIRCLVRSSQLLLQQKQVDEAFEQYCQIESLIKRGVDCGAFIDPWNILAFQGIFPLFQTREDALPDPRVDILVDVMELEFKLASRVLIEAAATGNQAVIQNLTERFDKLADWWDKFGTTTVEEVPTVIARDYYDSAVNVANVLTHWKANGQKMGDLAFWKENVERFDTAIAFSGVVESLLDKGDDVASMGLLMQWLCRSEEFGLESGSGSLHDMLLRWMSMVSKKMQEQPDLQSSFQLIRKLFDFLEANAGALWHAPHVDSSVETGNASDAPPLELHEEDLLPGGSKPWDTQEEEDDFSSAYEEMSFKDSADDGNEGALHDGSGFSLFDTTEIERLQRRLEKHLRFLHTLSQLWQFSADFLMRQEADQNESLSEEQLEVVAGWHQRLQSLQLELSGLMSQLEGYEIAKPSGEHDANIEYDIQRHAKYQLLSMVITTLVSCLTAEWAVAGCLPKQKSYDPKSTFGLGIVPMYRALLHQDSTRVRKQLPGFLKKIRTLPLLYIPFEHGGKPKQILAAQSLQAILRLMIAKLPELGMHRESWHVLESAFTMENTYRPGGPSVTEFDRLFRIGFKASLTNLIQSSLHWKTEEEPFSDDDRVSLCAEVIEKYMDIWQRHSRTMRLSAVEPLEEKTLWAEVQEFVSKYGSALFHAQSLTLGNVRTILQIGIVEYLRYLSESSDVLNTPLLIEDLDNKRVDIEDVSDYLNLIYQIIIDKYDRFLEYNTTTTQSDYGEKFSCFLDFMRVESRYEKDEWNYLPFKIAHEVFVNEERMEAAEIWEQVFQQKTERIARKHVKSLDAQQEKHGVKLPGIADHLKEQFVKPLAVNRMLALVKHAMKDVQESVIKSAPFEINKGKINLSYLYPQENQTASAAFESLVEEVESYQDNLHGSSIEIPEWLRLLDSEVLKSEASISKKLGIDSSDSGTISLPQKMISKREINRQLGIWNEPILTGKTSKKKKKSPPPKED